MSGRFRNDGREVKCHCGEGREEGGRWSDVRGREEVRNGEGRSNVKRERDRESGCNERVEGG